MKKQERINSFKLLWKAVKDSRQAMWISIQVLIVITLVLATIFFIAEYKYQEEEYSYWGSLVWAFTRYIEDPGEFSQIAPVTITGRWMATLIGIVGILIFAVPAGLIGGAFTQAIDQEQRNRHLVVVGEKLSKAFRRVQDRNTLYRCVPRYLSICTLQARKEMSEKDIIDAVRYNKAFRLRNLATAEVRGAHKQDRLVVEMFPLNTSYGCCINRNSDITICCPTAYSEAGIGNFSFYLALIGGFNYISKEIEIETDEPETFYYYGQKENSWSDNKIKFLADLKSVAGTGENKWVFFLIESNNSEGKIFQIATATTPQTGIESSIINVQGFDKFYQDFSKVMEGELEWPVTLNVLKPITSTNIGLRIGGGKDLNAMTIRVNSEFTTWNYDRIKAAKEFAIVINRSVGNPDYEIPEKLLKEKGEGYLGI